MKVAGKAALGGTLPVPSAAAVFGDRSVGRGTLQELEPVSCWEEEERPGHEAMWPEGSRKIKNKAPGTGNKARIAKSPMAENTEQMEARWGGMQWSGR